MRSLNYISDGFTGGLGRVIILKSLYQVTSFIQLSHINAVSLSR